MELQTQAVSPFHPAILSVFVKNKVEVLIKNENRCTLVLKHGTYIDDINSQIIKLLPKERYYTYGTHRARKYAMRLNFRLYGN